MNSRKGVQGSTRNRNLLIKGILLALFMGMLIWQLFFKNDIAQLYDAFKIQLSQKSIWLIVLMVVLMPLNWFLETKKWHKLLKDDQIISIGKALKAVFGGVTLSLLTPNRIGEYGGRVLFIPIKNQWTAVIATLVGSFSQNLSNILFGFMGLILMPGIIIFKNSLVTNIIVVSILIIFFVFYLNIHWVNQFFEWRKWPHWIEKRKHHLGLLNSYRNLDLIVAFLLSSLRYIVFSLQFVLILYFFGLEVPILQIWLGVTLVYLFHTGIPLPPFVDVLARSEIALIIWQSYQPNELSVIFASFGIWIINLVIPALIGLLFIEQVNVVKALGYETEKHV